MKGSFTYIVLVLCCLAILCKLKLSLLEREGRHISLRYLYLDLGNKRTLQDSGSFSWKLENSVCFQMCKNSHPVVCKRQSTGPSCLWCISYKFLFLSNMVAFESSIIHKQPLSHNSVHSTNRFNGCHVCVELFLLFVFHTLYRSSRHLHVAPENQSTVWEYSVHAHGAWWTWK